MKRRLMIVLALVIAFTMVLAACGGGGSGGGGGGNAPATASDDVKEFIANVTLGEPVSPNWKRIFDSLDVSNGGPFDVTVYWSGSLIPIPEIPKGLGSGAATFSNVPSPNYPDVLPLNCRILNLPFIGLQDPVGSAEIYMQLLDEFPEMKAEMATFGIYPLGATTLGVYGLHFVDQKPVRLPQDMSGRQIVPYNTVFLPVFEEYNAAGTYIPPGQIYEALEKGVVDGYINNWAFQGWFALTDLMRQHVDFGTDGAFHEWNILCVNLDFWNSLTPELQKLLEDTYRYNGGYKDLWSDTANMVEDEMNKAREKGDLMEVLTDEEIQVWKDKLEPLIQPELDDIAKVAGDVAYDIYDRALELIAEKW